MNLFWPSSPRPWYNSLWQTLHQQQPILHPTQRQLVRVRFKWGRRFEDAHPGEAQLIRLKLTFHFCCQSGLWGPAGSLWACGWTESLFQSRCFQVDTTVALGHWGPTDRDGVVTMRPQKDPGGEAVNSNYTPHPQSSGRFLLLEAVTPCFHSTVGLCYIQNWLQTFFIQATNWPAAVTLTQTPVLVVYPLHFCGHDPPKNVLLESKPQITDRP